MKVLAKHAAQFLAHPSQQVYGAHPGNLTDDFEFRALQYACLAFHRMPWPDVWCAHLMVKPEGWGKIDSEVMFLLREFAPEVGARRIVSWADGNNRAVTALCRRLGFEEDGKMLEAIMWGWSCR